MPCVERQLLIRTGLILRDESIPFDHFGYDDSMRGKVMEAFLWAMGQAPIIVSYVGEPDETPMYPARWTGDGRDRRLVNWKDECRKFVSQVWFFGAAVVHSGMFRCHPSAMPALSSRPPPLGRIRRQSQTRRRKQSRLQRPPAPRIPRLSRSLFGAFHIASKKGLLKLHTNAARPSAVQQRATSILKQWRTRRPGDGVVRDRDEVKK